MILWKMGAKFTFNRIGSLYNFPVTLELNFNEVGFYQLQKVFINGVVVGYVYDKR